jgi:hypothetical protein
MPEAPHTLAATPAATATPVQAAAPDTATTDRYNTAQLDAMLAPIALCPDALADPAVDGDDQPAGDPRRQPLAFHLKRIG